MTITAAMSSNMLIREILAARRVYLPNNGYFQSVKQMEDLAHRLESIGHNNQVSAVIIAPHDNTNYKSSGDVEDVNQLPLLATRSLSENYTSFMDPQEQVTFFLGTNWESEDYKQQFLTLQKLVHIVHRMAPAPTVSISHGNVQDGGFALCIGRYNIATEKSSFQVLNPRRGLTLDGGLSFVLPRLGFGLSHLMKNKKDLSTIPMGKVLAFDYQQGQEVLKLRYKPGKMEPRADGPFRIESVHTNRTLTIRLADHVVERISIRRVKPYRR